MGGSGVNPGKKEWAEIKSLGKIGTVWSLGQLREIAVSDDWRFRRSAIEAIGGHALAGIAQDVILAALSDESEHVVRSACDVCAGLKLAAAHERLIALTESRDASTRISAVGALEMVWQEDDFEQVLRMFSEDPDKRVRERAAWALRRRVTRDHWFALFEAWTGDPLARRRTWACEIAAEFGAAQVAERLREMENDRDGHVRKGARRALDTL